MLIVAYISVRLLFKKFFIVVVIQFCVCPNILNVAIIKCVINISWEIVPNGCSS